MLLVLVVCAPLFAYWVFFGVFNIAIGRRAWRLAQKLEPGAASRSLTALALFLFEPVVTVPLLGLSLLAGSADALTLLPLPTLVALGASVLWPFVLAARSTGSEWKLWARLGFVGLLRSAVFLMLGWMVLAISWGLEINLLHMLVWLPISIFITLVGNIIASSWVPSLIERFAEPPILRQAWSASRLWVLVFCWRNR